MFRGWREEYEMALLGKRVESVKSRSLYTLQHLSIGIRHGRAAHTTFFYCRLAKCVIYNIMPGISSSVISRRDAPEMALLKGWPTRTISCPAAVFISPCIFHIISSVSE